MADLPLLTFEEARDYFRSLIPMTDVEWSALAEEIRMRAFTVSHVASMDALLEIHNQLDRRLAEGIPYEEFQQNLLSIFEDRGWIGPEPYRYGTIFDTNIQTAYGVGRHKQHTDMVDLYPYGEYIDVGDERVRHWHRRLRGTIAPMNSHFWVTHYPPWEFR